MRQLLELDESREPANLLVQNIVQKAEGVFIWVRLVVEDISEGLTDGDTLDELQQWLANIPTDLEELYRRVIENIKKQYVEEAHQLFKIVHVFNGPIPLLQLALATKGPQRAIDQPIEFLNMQGRFRFCEEMARRLRSRCGCLLEITGDFSTAQPGTADGQVVNPTEAGLQIEVPRDPVALHRDLWTVSQYKSPPQVQFIHETAKAFFSQPSSWELFSFLRPHMTFQDPWVCLMASYVHYIKLDMPYFTHNEHIFKTEKRSFLTFGMRFIHTKVNFIEEMLRSAKKAELSTCQSQILLLTEFDRTLQQLYRDYVIPELEGSERVDSGWVNRFVHHNSFTYARPRYISTRPLSLLHLAIHWNLLLYTNDVLKSDLGSIQSPETLLFFLNTSKVDESIKMMNTLLVAGMDPNYSLGDFDSLWVRLLRSIRVPQVDDDRLRLIRLCVERGGDAKIIVYGTPVDGSGVVHQTLSVLLRDPKIQGYNPLHFLLQRFPLRRDKIFVDLVSELARRGADPYQVSTYGWRPLDFADYIPDIAEAIKQAYQQSGGPYYPNLEMPPAQKLRAVNIPLPDIWMIDSLERRSSS